MLGWALKKGLQGATGTADAPPAEDTTQLEGPDTPAPVFAARAIKSVIFGASADDRIHHATIAPPNKEKTTTKPKSRDEPKSTDALAAEFRSPTKLNSILLTPGTGTARRKRVSFGGDVKTSNSVEPSPFEINKTGSRRNTALQEALENSRKNNKLTTEPSPAKESENQQDTDDIWEEENSCNHDVTVDLNEPHSGSGKYWKSEFDRYHEDAKAEMTALVKYKHLAKSYAKQKDEESIELARRLREEQERVAMLERKLQTLGASQSDGERLAETEREQSALAKELGKQTALATEYRIRIRELEATIKDRAGESDSDRAVRRHHGTSPRTEKNLLEANRELRRARAELKQMGGLQDENERLKNALKAAQAEATRVREQKSMDDQTETSRTKRLEAQLRELKEESRQEKSELRKITREYETLKKDAKLRTAEAMQVLEDKNKKINQLENDLKAAKAERKTIRHQDSFDQALATHHRLTRDLKTDIDARNTRSGNAETRRPRQPRRSVSAEDFTLDYTSQFNKTPDYKAAVRGSSDEYGARRTRSDGQDARQAASYRSIGARKAAKADGWEASGPEQPTDDADYGVGSARVLSELNNESSHKSNRLASQGTSSSGYLSRSQRRTTSSGAVNGAADHRVPHGFPRAGRSAESHAPSQSRRALSAYDDDQGIDLLQDRFAHLGEGETEKPSSGNTSRCSLPPDRLAAARARLQQKKMERMRAGGDRIPELEKENFEP